MALVINGVEPKAIIVNGVGLDAVQVSKDNKVVVVWVFAVPKSAEISGTITRAGGSLSTTYYADITIYNPNGYACDATIKEYAKNGRRVRTTSNVPIEANSNYETSGRFNDNSRTGAYKVQVTLTNEKGSSTSKKTWNGYQDGGDETTTTTTT